MIMLLYPLLLIHLSLMLLSRMVNPHGGHPEHRLLMAVITAHATTVPLLSLTIHIPAHIAVFVAGLLLWLCCWMSLDKCVTAT